ncbi:MAG: hypothetical protein ACK5XO_07970 [Phycisphaerales bacterium]|jgi:hypothetical protein|nr:MAG: hypothetical protein IPK69_13870 [Phycisphaerales bacterium]
MITITIEETDKDGQLLGRHVASAPIDKNDTKGIGSLLARSVGGLMYHTEARAEIPLLIAAAGTHRASSCTRAIGHAAGLATGTYGFDLAIKPVIEIDRLLDYRASKRDRETAAQTLKIMGATIRRREDNE